AGRALHGGDDELRADALRGALEAAHDRDGALVARLGRLGRRLVDDGDAAGGDERALLGVVGVVLAGLAVGAGAVGRGGGRRRCVRGGRDGVGGAGVVAAGLGGGVATGGEGEGGEQGGGAPDVAVQCH